MRKFLGLGLFLAILFGAPSAYAHAMLHHSIPGAGDKLSSPPEEIRLEYNQDLQPGAWDITLTRNDNQAIPIKVVAAPSDAATLIVKPGRTLPPGIYELSWHVTSVDTHETQGSFSFTIKP